MSKFEPPIHSRSITELIAIAYGTEDEWQSQAIEEAKEELILRKIPLEYQQEIISKWEREQEKIEVEYKLWLEKNQNERYTYWEMIKILFAAPVILTGRAEVGHSLTDLRRFNYNIKLKQRMFLLSCGVITWIGLFLGLVKVGENIKMKEIEKVDISEWENNRIIINQEQ